MFKVYILFGVTLIFSLPSYGDVKRGHVREGGHVLECLPSTDKYPVHGYYFIDYVATVDHQDEVFVFENEITHFERVLKRLKEIYPLYASSSWMSDLQKYLREYSLFRTTQNKAYWFPYNGPLGGIVNTRDAVISNSRLEECNSDEVVIHQAVVHDQGVYYFDPHIDAALLNQVDGQVQLSFRTSHEGFRRILVKESRQIQRLNKYFHTAAFFSDDIVQVRESLFQISSQYSSNKYFPGLYSNEFEKFYNPAGDGVYWDLAELSDLIEKKVTEFDMDLVSPLANERGLGLHQCEAMTLKDCREFDLNDFKSRVYEAEFRLRAFMDILDGFTELFSWADTRSDSLTTQTPQKFDNLSEELDAEPRHEYFNREAKFLYSVTNVQDKLTHLLRRLEKQLSTHFSAEERASAFKHKVYKLSL